MPFKGAWLTSDDEPFAPASAVVNERLQTHPAVIAQCADARDVAQALSYAQSAQLDVSVRSAGNSVAGWSSNSGGLVIDVRPLRTVDVEPTSRECRIGGGVASGEALHQAGRFGLAPVMGSVPTIGLASLATGAGEGYLSPRLGLASDHLLSAELVTVDGRELRASPADDPELYWGIRGAGSNFGVVTSLVLRLHEVPTHAVGGSVMFAGPLGAKRALLESWGDLEVGAVGSWPILYYGCDGELGPILTIYPGHTGTVESADRECQRLRALPGLSQDSLFLTTYSGLVHQFDGELDFAGREYWDHYRLPFGNDPEACIELLSDQIEELAKDQTLSDSCKLVLWRTTSTEAPEPPSAAPRLPGVNVVVCASWEDPAADDRHIGWARKVSGHLAASGLALEASGSMHHVSVAPLERVRAVYGANAYQRLAQLKKRVDPHNILRHNFNVLPEA